MPGRTIRSGWLRAAVGLAISAAFVAITLTRVNLDLLGESIARLSVPLVGLIVVLSVIEVGVRAARWRGLLRPLADPGYPVAYGLLSIGHLANALLPARLGDVARALLAGSRLGVSRASVLGTIVVERVADAGLLAIAASAGIVIGYSTLGDALALLLLAGAGLAALAGLGLLLLTRPFVSGTRLGGLLLEYARLIAVGGASLREPYQLARVAALTVASFGLAVLILQVALSAAGLSMPLWQSALVMAAITLSTAIPAGPASIGTYEFVGMSLMVSLGLPAEPSLLAVGLVHALVTVVPAVVGLGALWAMGIRPISSRFGTRIGQSA